MINYIYETLGLKCNLSAWKESSKLPMFLKNKIEYYLLKIEDTGCIVMKVEVRSFKVTTLMNNIVQIGKYTDKPVVLWMDSLTTYQRQALIKNHISFIVPGSQLYLPFAGMIFKEHLLSENKKAERLSAMGQFVLLYILYRKHKQDIYQNQIAVDLKISAMNVSRAVKELVAFGLIEAFTEGKNKIIKPVSSGRDFYEICKTYLQSPIQKTIYVEPDHAYLNLPKAGELSLGLRTTLNPPKHMCVALDRRNKEIIEEQDTLDIDVIMPDTEYIEIQLWKYNPDLFADENGVDVISLAASLRSCADERVEAAVEEMLEEYRW